jgi:hypothetical protein
MINVPYQELPPAKRRRLMFRTALRSLLFTTVLVVLYYVLPLDERLNAGVAVRLLIGFLAFAAMATWQVRSIIGARYPAVKAIEVLGLIPSPLPVAVRLDVFRAGTSLRGELHRAADPHGRLVLRCDRLLDGGFRGHCRQVRGRPGGAYLPDAWRPGASGRRCAGAAGGRAPWSATRIGYRWRSHLGGRLSQPGFTHVG